MNRIIPIFFFLLLGGCVTVNQHTNTPTQEQMVREMIIPAPRISNVEQIPDSMDEMQGVAFGTGTSIVSRPLGDKYETFVVTNAHVVQPMMKAELAKKIQEAGEDGLPEGFSMKVEETFNPIYVTYYLNHESWLHDEIQTQASVVVYDEVEDVALLRILADRAFPTVNIPQEEVEYQVFETVYSVGAGMGNNPFPTRGNIALTSEINIAPDDEPERLMRKILFTAQVVDGASGGPTFQYSQGCQCWEWIAINQQIQAKPVPVQSNVVALPPMGVFISIYHMHWGIPVSEIRKVLEDTDFEGLLDK